VGLFLNQLLTLGTGVSLNISAMKLPSMSFTGRGTICNMCAEIRATTSTFGYDESMERYLRYRDHAEGNLNTYEFVASPELVTALTIA
jgi:aconitase A